ncbi:Fasciclin-2 [Fasciola hepatica]|uniref:Fasciclin-2 n=1 Tax=Fasciola hepatica TaxID=6192 RepID=A0A4E0RG53_FASHE|nr:Fasciclin-2 [Fasciola hepatica]
MIQFYPASRSRWITMIRSIYTIFLLTCVSKVLPTCGQSVMALRAFCSKPNTISIVGGAHSRLVNEGGRVTLTCCMPGMSNGHDHEQLIWIGPGGRELANHFSAPHSRAEHVAYSVPDFRSPNHLVTMLVIQSFQMEDIGEYTCRKANPRQTEDPVSVMIIPRPRLLADFIPLAPTNAEDSGSAVVVGRPVFVVLEEGRSGQLACRRNPQFRPDQVQITWYFQGRQLIAPAMAIPRPKHLLPVNGQGHFNKLNENSLTQAEFELAQLEKEKEMLEASRRVGIVGDRPVSLDPSELGISILEDGQVLSIHKANSRHSGTYLCKAEALNPTWTAERSPFDPPPYESGAIEAPMLVQLQAIRGIVFSPPRMLPGSPSEVNPTKLHEPVFAKMKLKRDTWASSSMMPGERYYMQPLRRTPHDEPFETSRNIFRQMKPVAQEGGQLTLECQARGKPTPQLLWYRGGMGTNMLVDSKAITFDQRIKEALQHLPLADVQRQLGILIADNNKLYPAIAKADQLSERSQVVNFDGQTASDVATGEMLTHKLGRFEMAVGTRKDDTGDPVIMVSRLTINGLQPSDATRYTCLALLDLGQYGGSGNYTDVGSVLPDVIMRPRIIKYGTNLHASGYPGENATLTCEAYGGLDEPQGLRIHFLRGPNVPRLIKSLGSIREKTEPDETFEANTLFGMATTAPSALMFQSAPSNTESSAYGPIDRYAGRLSSVHEIERGVERVRPDMDSRHHLSKTVDPHNPYVSILQLNVTDLRPEDNAYYACEVQAGAHWRVVAPTAHEGAGRLTVWFAPVDVEPITVGRASGAQFGSSFYTEADGINKSVVYGLSHLSSKLACQAHGQPPPTWTWHGPQTGPDIPIGESNGPGGYTKIDYQDGEWSVTELNVPASYLNVGVFGTYSCIASNRLGSATGLIRLKLATHPDKPSLRACKVEAQVIELCVDPPKDSGGLPLTHYELLIQTHPQGGFYGPFAYLPGRRLVRLPHLIPGYYYRFALSAVSDAGRGPNAYLEVTTNKLSTPAIKMLTAQEYIEPNAYNVHWKTSGSSGPDIEQYKISIRPVEVDYSMGEISGRPIGGWTEYTIASPQCSQSNADSDNYPICQYRVENLQPDKAYELELSAKNSVGFAQAQRIIFRTSSVNGASGRMLNMPSYLRQAAGNTARSEHSNRIPDLLVVFVWFLMQQLG